MIKHLREGQNWDGAVTTYKPFLLSPQPLERALINSRSLQAGVPVPRHHLQRRIVFACVSLLSNSNLCSEHLTTGTWRELFSTQIMPTR